MPCVPLFVFHYRPFLQPRGRYGERTFFCMDNAGYPDDRTTAVLLMKEDRAAWQFVLSRLIDQEKKAKWRSQLRADWGVDLYDLLGRLYEDMIFKGRLANYRGEGSLIGWMRHYLEGYLKRANPNDGRLVDIDGVAPGSEGDERTLGEKIAFELSESHRGDAYSGEGLPVLRNENWSLVQKCFAELWQRNAAQAYVMLLKLRFHMPSLEIKERLGISSAANVDQLFARAVKQMKELKVKNEC